MRRSMARIASRWSSFDNVVPLIFAKLWIISINLLLAVAIAKAWLQMLFVDHEANTALHHAVIWGRVSCVVWLLSRGADLSVENGDGDLVITDVVMPDENGLDLVPKIRRIRPNLRIVVMSAQNTLLTAVKATERGAFEYLPKPFDIDEDIQEQHRRQAQRQ